MKKKLLFVLLGVLYGTTVYADEMVITLESGNTLVIHYTGTINGVSLQGTSDTIQAMQKHETGGDSNSQVLSSLAGKQPVAQTREDIPVEKKAQARTVQFGWADPKMED